MGGQGVEGYKRTNWSDNNDIHTLLPDYLNDLNAMHKVVASLPAWQQTEWASQLRAIVVRDATPDMIHPDTGIITDGAFYNATAAQRAEAFLRTIGKWKD